MKRRRVLASISGAVSFAGCLSSVNPGDEQSPTETNTSTPPEDTSSSTSVCKGAWVSFWGLEGEPQGRHWKPDVIRLGYEIAEGDALFVAYENETVLGVSHVSADKHGLTADGDPLRLNSRLSGEHTLRVVLYNNSNKNGEFDPTTDTSCQKDGELIQAGPRTIDFSRFEGNTTGTTSK